jgi:predicted molibdopterin-dependent oxidoreductase YjgC
MSSREESNEEKVDVKKLVSVLPAAGSLTREKQKKIKEKRVKMKKKEAIEKGTLMLSSQLAHELEIKNLAEISVKGKRIRLKALISDNVPQGEVWGNANDMKELGIEDNSTVSLRAYE